MARRTSELRVRTTREERDRWHALAAAAGLTLSELVRRSLDRVRTWTAGRADLERERNIQLARIGNNVNQLARWAHTHKGAADTVLIVARLSKVAEQLRAIRDEREPPC